MSAQNASLEFLDCALGSVEIARLCGGPGDRERWIDRACRWAQLAVALEAGGNAPQPELQELLGELDGDWVCAGRELRNLAAVLRAAGEDSIVIECDPELYAKATAANAILL